MDNKDFDEFVKRQQGGASVTSAEINWEKERDDWLAHLDHLYTKIESFLTKYVSSGQIRYEYRLIELNEENIGDVLGTRELMSHLRDLGDKKTGPAAMTKADRSQFLSTLDQIIQSILRTKKTIVP